MTMPRTAPPSVRSAHSHPWGIAGRPSLPETKLPGGVPLIGVAQRLWEAVKMPTETGPLDGAPLASARPQALALTRVAYQVNLTYLLWFWITFTAGYWVYSWFDLEPGVDTLPDAGGEGWIALTG